MWPELPRRRFAAEQAASGKQDKTILNLLAMNGGMDYGLKIMGPVGGDGDRSSGDVGRAGRHDDSGLGATDTEVHRPDDDGRVRPGRS
ncbi:hypothetical protein Apa02nite_094460 [Actinoplanes palleronii]|uniref:Uncharacterized protein n=1 Tax=Actinoplanes palleronii TaxID=113570 RepID=A0ABQ4BRN7_9ACTN|nr:hypothetical protein Apa02nite_094460 [Actinoplanes palleronii]